MCEKQATFHGFEFLRILFRFKKRKENLSQTGRFYIVVVQWTSKKCTKKRDGSAELLF